MMTLPSSVKIYVATEPVDARKSFDGLSAIVESQFGKDPLSGHVFVFINRRGHQIQMLFWDRNGFSILRKRLEAGTFRLAQKPEGALSHVEINGTDLALMMEGIELAGVTRRKRYSHPETAAKSSPCLAYASNHP